MLVLCALSFYVSRMIIRKVENNLRQSFMLAGSCKYGSVLAGTFFNAMAPSLSRQLAYKISEASFIFHQQNHPSNEEKDKIAQEISIESLLEATGRNSAFYLDPDAVNSKCNNAVQSKTWNLLFDEVVGLLFYVIVWSVFPPDVVAFYFIHWRDATHQFLNRLLDWLMGAPAGLKLNQEMTVFFGNFFVYHIYIWVGYLSILEPYYISIIKTLLNSSLFGFSVMLSLASDTLRFLTFHTYCFYVYAAKVYKLQLKALISLSRLMRGKKWNPLRERVDSIPYDPSQLAFGTIIFTILLFLLPTTGIYYLVFTSLRLPVMVLTAVAFCSVRTLNTIPVHEILERVLKSSRGNDKLSMNLCYGRKTVEFQNDLSRTMSNNGALLRLNDKASVVIGFSQISFQELIIRKTDFGCQSLLPFHVFLKSLLLGDIVDMINTQL